MLADGTEAQVALEEVSPGRFEALWEAPEVGLYRLVDGEEEAVIAPGPAAPREFEETIASGEVLAPIVEPTGGGVLRIEDGLPSLREVREGRPAAGRGWIGITPRGAASVSGVTHRPLLPGWAWLCIVAGLALVGWLAEGRGWGRGRAA